MEQHPRTNRPKGEGSIYQKTNGVWMYSIMHAGKRLTKSLGTHDEKEAQKKYLKVRNQFAGKIDRGELEPTTIDTVTLDELLDSYITHLNQNQHKSVSIIQSVIGKVRVAPEFGNGEKASRKVASLVTNDFDRYRNRLTGDGASHSTVNNHLAYVRAALYHESKKTPSRVGKVPHIPIVRVNNARDGFLEYDDHVSVLEALPSSLKSLFVVAVHSGCRKGELLNMRWNDVDFTNRIIRLPKTKNGRQRNLPFWGSIEPHMRKQKAYRDEQHPDCDHVFFWYAEDCQLAHGGNRSVPGSPVIDFRGSWDNAIEEAHRLNPNVPANLLFHDLRRSGVRTMVQEAGIPEAQAMLISGHETRSMLERYNIVSLRNIQDAGTKLDQWQMNRKGSKSTAGSKSKVGSKRSAGSKGSKRTRGVAKDLLPYLLPH